MQNIPPSAAPQPASRAAHLRQHRSLPRYGLDVPARPTPMGTLLILLSLLLSWGMGRGNTASEILFPVAIVVGLGILGSFMVDAQHGIYNLVRTDVLMLLALYALLYLEFLFPQPESDLVQPRLVQEALNLSLVALGCLVIGRHLVNMDKKLKTRVFLRPMSPKFFLTLFWFCFFVGFFHQWFAVKFNPLEWFEAMLGPRFSQPWSRGRLGDWKALISELGALLYLIPPVGAIILTRPQRYGFVQRVAVGLGVLVVFFAYFAGGTRHQLFIAMFSFVMAYCYFHRLEPRKFVGMVMAFGLVLALLSQMMLAFRSRGLATYVRHKMEGRVYMWEEKSLFVDYNMVSMANLLGVVPDRQPFLGINIYYYTLIRPIPRALWKNKPDAGGAEIDAALAQQGAEGTTFAVTYIGEAWMAWGWFSVIGMSLFFGALSSWWNRFVNFRATDLAIIIFASGMLTMLLSMRSFIGILVTVLPTLFLVIVASWFMVETAPHLLHRVKAAAFRGSRDPHERRGSALPGKDKR